MSTKEMVLMGLGLWMIGMGIGLIGYWSMGQVPLSLGWFMWGRCFQRVRSS